MTEAPLKIVLVDDHSLCRNGLTDLLQQRGGMQVAASTGDPTQVVDLLREHTPSLVVLDLRMPTTDGLTLLRQIRAEGLDTPALFLTMSDSQEDLAAALRAGARGYLLKGALKDEILRAIRGVYHGEAIFSPAVAQWLINYFAGVRPTAPAYAFPELTEREREILSLIGQHRTNREIADLLVLSEKTVRNHVSNIFTKLQVSDRSAAIVKAREAGLGGPREG